MYVIELGRVTLDRFVHPLNDIYPIFVTELGIVKLVKLEHS